MQGAILHFSWSHPRAFFPKKMQRVSLQVYEFQKVNEILEVYLPFFSENQHNQVIMVQSSFLLKSMTHPKKINDRIKTDKFLNNFPFVFLVQHQNLTVKEWLQLQNTIHQHLLNKGESSKQVSSQRVSQTPKNLPTELHHSFFEKLEILNVKNSVLRKSFQETLSGKNPDHPENSLRATSKDHFNLVNNQSRKMETIDSLCQGPNFLLGCRDEIYLPLLWTTIQSHPKLVFICCFYKNKLLTHLDVEALLKTQNSVYLDFLSQLNHTRKLIDMLKGGCIPYPLLETTSGFFKTLLYLKNQN